MCDVQACRKRLHIKGSGEARIGIGGGDKGLITSFEVLICRHL